MLSKEEQLAAIERYYSSRVAGLASDEEELAVAQALLEQAERGYVVDDDGDGLILIEKAAEIPVKADFMVNDEELRKQGLRRILPIVAFVAIGLALIFVLYGGGGENPTEDTPPATAATFVTLATSTLTPSPTPTSRATATPSPTPTNTPTPTITPTATPTPLPPEEIEVKPEPVELESEAVIPVSLEIAGRYYPVVPTGLRDDAWTYVADPGRASWLAGSYVNVVLGLPYTGDNAGLLQNTLAISDTLTVRNSVAAVNHYVVADRHLANVYEIEAFGQRRAGLTLVLLGDSHEGADYRLVVWAVPLGTPDTTGGKEVKDSQGN